MWDGSFGAILDALEYARVDRQCGHILCNPILPVRLRWFNRFVPDFLFTGSEAPVMIAGAVRRGRVFAAEWHLAWLL
jgi:hypothetical protein